MKRRTPITLEAVREAIAVCDPDDRDPALRRFEAQFETELESIGAVQNLEERLGQAAGNLDYAVEPAGVAMAIALILYHARHSSEQSSPRGAPELLRLAALSRWHGRPPEHVADWLARRGALSRI